MSEPAAIIVNVQLPPEDYRQLLRQIKEPLANCIFSCLQERSDYGDFYLFKYHQKQQMLYALAWFNYGGDINLMETEEWKVFQQLLAALPPGAHGYCIGSYWATKPDDQNSYDFSYAIKNGQATTKTLTYEVLKSIEADANTYLFKKAATFNGFQNDLFAGKMVDKKIVEEIKDLQQAFILDFVKKNHKIATFRRPVSLGENYYYNGSFLYTFLNYTQPKIFSDINLQALRKTDYGFSDEQYALLPRGKIPINGGKLKVLQKGHAGSETIYYVSNEGVYNESLTPVTVADPATFKLLSSYLAVDKNYCYLNGKALAKTAIGDYTFDDSGYYNSDVILIGNKTVWMGSGEQLSNIDAPTFEILTYNAEGLPQAGFGSGYLFLRKCRDKQGLFFIYRINLQAPVKIDRATDFEAFLEDQKAYFQSNAETVKAKPALHAFPNAPADAYEELYYQCKTWFSSERTEKLKMHQYEPWFYATVNNYFHACWQLYQQSGNNAYLNDAKIIYEILQDGCWLNPYIFHNMACIYVALDLKKEAEEALVLALHHRYERMANLLQDQDLDAIKNDETMAVLKKHFDVLSSQWQMISAETLWCFEEKIQKEKKHKIAAYLLDQYSFWDQGWIIGYAERQPAQKDYFEKWQTMNNTFIEKYMFISPTGLIYTGINKNQYYKYMHFELLNPLIHLDFIERQFHDAHQAKNEEYIEKAYEAINQGFENLKKSLTVWHNENALDIVLQVQESDMWKLLSIEQHPG